MAALRSLAAAGSPGVCSVWGADDFQFPTGVRDKWAQALDEAGVASDMKVYDGVGHAFIDVAKARAGEQPQRDAWEQCASFIRAHFEGK